MKLNKIYNENCLTGLKKLADKSIDCCVTSPPYYGLRDYGTVGQIGLEETPELFVQQLVSVFNEVNRVLKDEGTLWLNLGDSYSGGKTGRTDEKSLSAWIDPLTGTRSGGRDGRYGETGKQRSVPKGYKAKDLIGIPWMVAFALRSSGYYLRQDIIWSKPNPMPESVTDRCTKSHEYIFMLSKSRNYYYDAAAIRTELKESSVSRLSQNLEDQAGSLRVPGKTNGAMKAVAKVDKQRGHGRRHAGFNDRWDSMDKLEQTINGANKRSVWTVATMPYSEAHFATFPERLIIDCIKAGCPVGGIVLDPFMGAGTTGLVARKLGRNFIGFELNPAYIQIAEKRLKDQLGMFI